MKTAPIPLLDVATCPTGRPGATLRLQQLAALAAHAPGTGRAYSFWLLLHVRRGRGCLWLAGQPLPLRAGHLVVLPPGPVVAWELGAACQGEGVCFTADMYLSQFPAPGLPAGPAPRLRYLPPAEQAEVRELLRGLARTLTDPAGRPEKARAYLHLLLTLALAGAATPPPAPRSEAARRFGTLLDAHFRTHKTVRAYADWLHLTADYLNVLCRRQWGRTASQLIRARVLAEARHLLRHLALPVGEVGYAVGFEDASYFVRYFRQHTGQTPAAFRKNPGFVL